MPAINALLLGTVMYRTRLVPRIIPTIGLIGAPILLASVIAAMFRINHPIMVLAGIGTLPIAAWEFSFGVWIVVKGFNPSPIIATDAPPAGGHHEGELVSAVS